MELIPLDILCLIALANPTSIGRFAQVCKRCNEAIKRVVPGRIIKAVAMQYLPKIKTVPELRMSIYLRAIIYPERVVVIEHLVSNYCDCIDIWCTTNEGVKVTTIRSNVYVSHMTQHKTITDLAKKRFILSFDKKKYLLEHHYVEER